jgi:hypothetical protein
MIRKIGSIVFGEKEVVQWKITAANVYGVMQLLVC